MIRKNPIVWGVGGICAIAIVVALFIFISQVKTYNSTTTTTVLDAVPSGNLEYVNLGDTITIGDWAVIADSYEVKDTIESSEYSVFTPDEGSKYVVISLTIKNLGTSSSTFIDYISQW